MRRRYQYASVAIAFTQESLERVGVDFCAPDHNGVDLARRRRMEIKTIVEWDLAVGYRALSQGPLHGRIAFWAPEVTHTEPRSLGVALRHRRLVQHKADDIRDGAKVRGVDVIAVKSDSVHFLNVKY